MNQLTHQEQKIVALVAQGLTNKEIAQRLGSSPFTVRNQVKIIIRKLEVKNRVQVAYLFGQQVNIAEIAVGCIKKVLFETMVRQFSNITLSRKLLDRKVIYGTCQVGILKLKAQKCDICPIILIHYDRKR